MKNLFFLLLVILAGILNVYAEPLTTRYENSEVFSGDYLAPDILISNFEPYGRFSGIAKANGTIYLAIPDTNTISNRCVIVIRSTNSGNSWSTFASVQPSGIVNKTKMVRSGLDSIYCFFLREGNIYCWNVENNNFNQISGNFRDFDAVASSTGALYLFQDPVASGSITRASSINGFISIAQSGTVGTGAFPSLCKSSFGDTLLLNYYGPISSDTITSPIRCAKYFELSPGNITIVVGSFIDVVLGNQPKPQFQSVFHGSRVWLLWTEGLTGNMDIKCRVSTNSGLNYANEFFAANNPNVDEYWFDARYYTAGTGGVDIAYYSDSLQSGPPSNSTDKILFKSASYTSPETFSSAIQLSEHSPVWSARNYIPAMVPSYSSSDAGVAWVGLDNTARRVYWNKSSAIIGVEKNNKVIVDKYILEQNYPNPFNPNTTINFTIPKNGIVSLKVFDVAGREVSILTNGLDMRAGTMSFVFDGSDLSSGVYFYTLLVENTPIATKKMALVK